MIALTKLYILNKLTFKAALKGLDHELELKYSDKNV